MPTLRAATGRGTDLVSLYIPAGRTPLDRLRHEAATAERIQDRTTRKHVLRALAAATSLVKATAPAETGLAVFAGETRDGFVSACVPLPFDPSGVLYRCGSAFHLDPIDAALHQGPKLGLVVMDRREATIGLVEGEHLRVLVRMESTVQGKHGQGGQSQHRFERIIQGQADAWFEKVCRAVNDLLVPGTVEVLLVGIPGLVGEEHLQHLHHEHRKRLAPPVSVGYTDEAGLRELLQAAGPMLQERGLMRAERRFETLLHALARDRAAYGRAQVEAALLAGRVEVVLVPAADAALEALAGQRGAAVEVLTGEPGERLARSFGVAALLRW